MKLLFLIPASMVSLSQAKPPVEITGKVDSKSIIGKWQVMSYEYKYANDPTKDYMASRSDFETMVKLKATYELKTDGSAIQSIGTWTQEYAYEVVNGQLKLYPCENLKAKETCIMHSKKNKDYGDYQLKDEGNSITFHQKNEVFILDIHLVKIK